MTALESIIKEIADYKEKSFSWEADNQKVIDMIGDLHFQGEVDGDALYMAFCMTFVDKNGGDIRYLTPEEADEYYVTKKITGLEERWVPSQWVVAYFHMKKMYLRVMVTENCLVTRSARENFSVAFTQNKDFMRATMARVKPRDDDFIHDKHDVIISDSYEHRDVFIGLAKVIEWSKTHFVGHQDFYQKIIVPWAKYFDDEKKAIRNENYSPTMPSETLTKPSEYKKHSIPFWVKSAINGASYESIFFKDETRLANEEENGKVKWTAEENGLSFLWTIVDFINNGAAKCNPIEETLEKVTLSNDWKPGEPASATFRLTKVNDEIVLELEVRQTGIVYLVKRASKDGK